MTIGRVSLWRAGAVLVSAVAAVVGFGGGGPASGGAAPCVGSGASGAGPASPGALVADLPPAPAPRSPAAGAPARYQAPCPASAPGDRLAIPEQHPDRPRRAVSRPRIRSPNRSCDDLLDEWASAVC